MHKCICVWLWLSLGGKRGGEKIGVGVGEFDGGRGGGRRVLQREVWGQVSGRGQG